MATEWTKRDVVELLDFYVWNLRILAGRSEGPDPPEEELCLPAKWSIEKCGRHPLYQFDLAGIKASGYPEVFDRPASAVYATPRRFLKFVADALKDETQRSAEGAFLVHEWLMLPARTIVLDPRYVAFRTAYDWVVLHAKLLAQDKAASGQALNLSGRPDAFRVELPLEVPYETARLIAGNPLILADGGFRNRWDPNYAEPWHQVRDRIEAIHYFHFRGTTLPQELRGGPDMNPKALADLVAMRITQDWNATALHAWRGWPPEEVESDPRFIAHKCAFNRGMIPRMATRHDEWRRSGTEALKIVGQICSEEFAAFFGETIECAGKPN
jgi:hypothetical protein